MGMPARRLVCDARVAGRERTHLRLVPTAGPRPRATASRMADAAGKSAFRLAAVALVTLTVLGLARVALSAKAAEASLDQLRLERSIKAESRAGDRLELDRSLLVTPSRIESEAAGLQMTKAPAVRYIAMPESGSRVAEAESPAKPAHAGRSGVRLAQVVGAALEVTEKEARTLLVGDVGVAASR